MVIRFYQNNRNPHKYMEVHYDGFGHRSWREIIQDEKVRNYVGDRRLHRENKRTIDDVLNDYHPTWHKELIAKCACCGKQGKYVVFGKEYDNFCAYVEGFDGLRSSAGMIQDLCPTVPDWIRAGAIKKEICFCPRCNPFK